MFLTAPLFLPVVSGVISGSGRRVSFKSEKSPKSLHETVIKNYCIPVNKLYFKENKCQSIFDIMSMHKNNI